METPTQGAAASADGAADAGVLTLQPAFVEGVERDGKGFDDLESAYRHIFRRNLEVGVLLWSAIPVPIRYTDDLPAMVAPILDLLGFVVGGGEGEETEFRFETSRIDAVWAVELERGIVRITSGWRRVPGGYEAALDQVGRIAMPREAFLAEWKLLLEQLLRAFADSGATVGGDDARDRLSQLRRLEAAIPERGRFYRY